MSSVYETNYLSHTNYKGCPFEYKDKERFEKFTLTEEQVNNLVSFCRTGFNPTKGYSVRYGSYTLKHIVEDQIGFYVPNCELKRAMICAGFRAMPSTIDEVNWCFNIGEKSPALQKYKNRCVKRQ